MTNKGVFAAVLVCVCLLLTLAGCADKYQPEDFLGKTSAEIVRQYGAFDCVLMPADPDGLYRNCQCGYTVKEANPGFLALSPEVLFFISFDENGVAVCCEEGHRPGG